MNKYLHLLVLFLSFNVYPWGEESHRLISRKAAEFLSAEMPGFLSWKDYIVQHSSDADKRKKTDDSEYPKHFIDLDFYPEFIYGRMITDRNQLNIIYGDSVVAETGLLPWATLDAFQNLVKAFKEVNRDKILIFSADLAHYVADGHQPLHTILNYDGQNSEQKGLHARYEIFTVQNYLNELDSLIRKDSVTYIKEPLNFIFDYMSNTNSVAEVILRGDRFAAEQAESSEGDEYKRLFWFRTKFITTVLFENAANSLASLIYTAWVDAGKPSLSDIN